MQKNFDILATSVNALIILTV